MKTFGKNSGLLDGITEVPVEILGKFLQKIIEGLQEIASEGFRDIQETLEEVQEEIPKTSQKRNLDNIFGEIEEFSRSQAFYRNHHYPSKFLNF